MNTIFILVCIKKKGKQIALFRNNMMNQTELLKNQLDCITWCIT
ncbi:hypothetical protein bcere0022_19990 [Bacillus cereus Rock3-44]|nr:hypothetical protein bcere0022_19990 [Bacillus cereus Rock3-44]